MKKFLIIGLFLLSVVRCQATGGGIQTTKITPTNLTADGFTYRVTIKPAEARKGINVNVEVTCGFPLNVQSNAQALVIMNDDWGDMVAQIPVKPLRTMPTLNFWFLTPAFCAHNTEFRLTSFNPGNPIDSSGQINHEIKLRDFIEGSPEQQGGGYSPPAARSSKPTP